MAIQRDLGKPVARIAADVSFNQASLAMMNEGGDFESDGIAAPPIGASLELSQARLVPNTLELLRLSDAHLYIPNLDYVQEVHGFQNLRISAGTPLTAEYLREEFTSNGHRILDEDVPVPQAPDMAFMGSGVRVYGDAELTTVSIDPLLNDPPEPFTALTLLNSWVASSGYATPGYYIDRERVYLRGRIEDGTVTAGTDLFTVPAGYRPGHETLLTTMTDAGPITLSVKTTGVIEIGPSPFEAGNGWLGLDGLSWRALTGIGPRYPAEGTYPQQSTYPNG